MIIRKDTYPFTCQADDWFNLSMLSQCFHTLISAHLKQQTPLNHMLNLHKQNQLNPEIPYFVHKKKRVRNNVQTKQKILRIRTCWGVRRYYHSNVVMWLATQTRELMFKVHFLERQKRVRFWDICVRCSGWFYEETKV